MPNFSEIGEVRCPRTFKKARKLWSITLKMGKARPESTDQALKLNAFFVGALTKGSFGQVHARFVILLKV